MRIEQVRTAWEAFQPQFTVTAVIPGPASFTRTSRADARAFASEAEIGLPAALVSRNRTVIVFDDRAIVSPLPGQ